MYTLLEHRRLTSSPTNTAKHMERMEIQTFIQILLSTKSSIHQGVLFLNRKNELSDPPFSYFNIRK